MADTTKPHTTTETSFRAVFRHTGIEGGSYCTPRSTPNEAWKDADDCLASYPESYDGGKWFVQITAVTTTTMDIGR